MKPFLEAVRGALRVREQYGFGVAFALVDEQHDEDFVWAATHDGDSRRPRPSCSRRRACRSLPANPAEFIDQMHVAMVHAERPDLLLTQERGERTVELRAAVRGEVVAGDPHQRRPDLLTSPVGSPTFSSSSPTISRTGTLTSSSRAASLPPGAEM